MCDPETRAISPGSLSWYPQDHRPIGITVDVTSRIPGDITAAALKTSTSPSTCIGVHTGATTGTPTRASGSRLLHRQIVQLVTSIGAKYGKTGPQVALKWQVQIVIRCVEHAAGLSV